MGVIFNIQEAVNNSAFNILQEPIKMILEREVEAFERESIIPKVFNMRTTDKYREEFRSVTAMDGFKPVEDMEPAGISSFEEGYNKQYVFQEWKNAFVVSKQVIEDNEAASIEPKALGFIKGYGRTRELYAVRMIGAALGNVYPEYRITANSGKGMDTVDGSVEGTKQQYFTNAHHRLNDSVGTYNQSNKFYASLTFDGSDALLPEKIADVIGQVGSIMHKYKDEKGNIVPVAVKRIVIAEDYVLETALREGLRRKFGDSLGGYEIVVSPYLSDITGFTDSDHALLLISPERNREGMGATWFDRVPLTVKSFIDDHTDANYWTGRARFGAGFGDFRAMSYIALTSSGNANATAITPVVAGKPVHVTNPSSAPVYTDEIA